MFLITVFVLILNQLLTFLENAQTFWNKNHYGFQMSHIMRVSTPIIWLTTSKVIMYSWWQDWTWSYIKTLKSNRGAGCELQIMGLKKRKKKLGPENTQAIWIKTLHHSAVQQLSKYITCLMLNLCSFFSVWMTFSLWCNKVCHFYQAMCFLLFSSSNFWFLFTVRKCRDRCWNNKENIF